MAPRRRAGAARAALIATAALLALAGVRTTPADAAPRRADLVVTATTPGRLVAASGGAVNTKVSVRNRGRATAPRTLLALYLSRDARLGGGDRFLASGEVPALAPGRTAVRSMIAKLPTPRHRPPGPAAARRRCAAARSCLTPKGRHLPPASASR